VSGTHRVLVVTDTHLAPGNVSSHEQLRAVAEHAARTGYDAVVHLGDVCVDAPRHPDQLAAARDALSSLGGPLHVIPGNHDVGDGPHAANSPSERVDQSRLARWADVFGPDRWRVDLGRWTLLGLDAQLLGSALDAEHHQWAWLREELVLAAGDGRRVVLCSHRPVHAPDGVDTVERRAWYVPEPAERGLEALIEGGAPVELALSGHVHQSRSLQRNGTRHEWLASSWAFLPPFVQVEMGRKEVGVAVLTVHDDGAAHLERITVPGLRQLEAGTDVPSPYA
jgi:3',5'-cyclic AMP phosphodiesterase CpdA